MTTSVEVLPATDNVIVEVDPTTGDITLEVTAPSIVLYLNEGLPGTVDTSTVQVLENKELISPKITTSILDTNGNELLLLTATASAVNELTYANAATGGKPTFSATGSDTNISINLVPKGTGTVQAGGVAVLLAGLQTAWIPASSMISRTTSGAAIGTVETATNKHMLRTFNFDSAAVEYVQFTIRMPKGWNEGTVTASFSWSHAATTTNFGVAWSLAGVAISDDDALDVAFGTAQTATDTGGTTDDLYSTATTSAITIAGTPAANDYVVFQVAREVANGSDTMAIDARLHGVQLYYSTDAATDA